MALTLLEAAKLSPEPLQRAVIETFAAGSDVVGALPFKTIAGSVYRYNQEGSLPGIGFRGVNEGFTESVGVINPLTEMLSISGGDLDVDRFIIQREPGAREVHEAMKLKSLAQQWSYTFIKGDSSSDPKSFDGLQTRLVGSQVVSNDTPEAWFPYRWYPEVP